ncbi:MAG TPA: SH3 domain-containing protein [Deltaproteobacteria bacterium]|nr:SH3 domain-containing protein [Deltaproteobacteria bacterium]
MGRILLVLVTLFACQGGEPQTPDPTDAPKPTPEAPAPEPEPEPTEGYVIGQTSLRKVPSEDKKIDNPDGDGKVSNWIVTLERGELVSIIGDEGEWSNVRTSEGKEGWFKTERMVPGTSKPAVLFEPGKLFKRPDLLALNTDKKLPAGTVIFALRENERFTEVDYPRSAYSSLKGWALTEDLVFDETEVEAAKIIARIMHLREKGDDSADQLEELVRSQFGGSKLLPLLDDAEEPGGEGDELGGDGAEGDGAEGDGAEGAKNP